MTHIPKLWCLDCQLEMRVAEIGVILKAMKEDGTPYYKISSDKFKCDGCGTQVCLVSSGTEPIAFSHEPNFETIGWDLKVRFYTVLNALTSIFKGDTP